jgi:DNA invertase Pin-like site-specific DNA recombinase
VGQERAKAEGRLPGRPPALTPDQVNECKRMFADNQSVSRVARIMKISWSTANKAIFNEISAQVEMQ